jgi:TonB family protein
MQISPSSMVRLLATAMLSVAVLSAKSVVGETCQNKPEKQEIDKQAFVNRCNPKIIGKPKLKTDSIRIRDGEKPSGFTPLVAFQILESGEVTRVHLKRSSGIRDVDKAALNWVRTTKYHPRPGCPVVDTETVVTIDHR